MDNIRAETRIATCLAVEGEGVAEMKHPTHCTRQPFCLRSYGNSIWFCEQRSHCYIVSRYTLFYGGTLQYMYTTYKRVWA